jgi:hypothetical protein
VHNIHYLKDIKTQINNCTFIEDKGYLPTDIQLNLFETCNIKLNTPMREKSKKLQKTALHI